MPAKDDVDPDGDLVDDHDAARDDDIGADLDGDPDDAARDDDVRRSDDDIHTTAKYRNQRRRRGYLNQWLGRRWRAGRLT